MGARADLEFFVDPAYVSIYSWHTYAEFFGDFFVKEALGEEVEDFAFARGEVFGFGVGGGGGGVRSRRMTGGRNCLLEGLDDFAGDVGAHGGAAGHDFAEGFEELVAFGVLEHVAGGAGGEGFENVIGVFVDGKHHELGVGKKRLEFADAFDAAEAGEVDVAENNARLEFGNFWEGGFNGAELRDAFEIRGAIDPLGPDLAIGGVVFDDGNGGAHATRLSKAAKWTNKLSVAGVNRIPYGLNILRRRKFHKALLSFRKLNAWL